MIHVDVPLCSCDLRRAGTEARPAWAESVGPAPLPA